MNEMKNRVFGKAGFIFSTQTSNPIALGDVGIWFDGTTTYFVRSDGTMAPLGDAPNTYHEACRLATAGALNACTYSAAAKTLTQNAAAVEQIDSVTVAVGDRILVKNQATASQNGIYVVTRVGTVAITQVLTRAPDCNTSAMFEPGFVVPVAEGTVNGDSMFQFTTNAPFVMDTNNAAFSAMPISITYAAAAQIADLDSGAESAGASNTVARGDHKHALAAGTLSADAAGRALVAADFFDEATLDDKIEDDAITAAVADAKIELGALGEDLLTANELTGRVVANAANVNTIGALPMVFRTLVASGANGDVDITLGAGMKIRVLDAWAVLKGAGTAGCLLTLKSTGNAITDAMDVAAGGDKDVFRCGEIDDAQQEIVAGGILRWTKASTGGDFPGAECYVLAIRVA
jgi:hypothetical protein